MPLFPFLLTLARSFFAPRVELMAEILALRQQLAILNRTTNLPFPDPSNPERKARSSQSPKSAAFTNDISGQLEVVGVELVPTTD
jgi:hypothetical protein